MHVIIQMELIKIKGSKVPAVTCDAATLAGCNDKETAFVAVVKGTLS